MGPPRPGDRAPAGVPSVGSAGEAAGVPLTQATASQLTPAGTQPAARHLVAEQPPDRHLVAEDPRHLHAAAVDELRQVGLTLGQADVDPALLGMYAAAVRRFQANPGDYGGVNDALKQIVRDDPAVKDRLIAAMAKARAYHGAQQHFRQPR